MGGAKVSLTLEQIGFYPMEEMLETGNRQKKLTIGIPREKGSDEHRIPLTPQGVELLADNGHSVVLQSNAGMGANYSDLDYSEAGAKVTDDVDLVFKSDIILKVAPFENEEIAKLKPSQTVFSAFQPMCQTTQRLMQLLGKKINAIGFEYIQGENNHFPIVNAMSEIAGLVSVTIAAEYLSNVRGGKGILLGGVSGVSPTEVAILGTGTAAEFAARAAIGLGARVRVLGSTPYKLRRIQHHLHQPMFTSLLQPQVLMKTFSTADVVIGAIDMGDSTQRVMVTEDMIRSMKPGSVVIDIGIDHGGCFETSRLTSHSNPVFRTHNVVHYGVANIASRVSRTASIALSNIIAPVLLEIGQAGGLKNVLKNDMGLRRGVYAYQGILTNSTIGKQFHLPSQNIDLLMAAL